MRIVFDICTPKQVRFFGPMMAQLRAAGCTVSVVTRNYVEVNLLMRSLRMRATVLGRHGGPSPIEKLHSFSERVGLLARHFARQRPDVLVTLSSAESSRAAFGLQIPIVCFNDLPTSRIIGRLTLPLASKVCAPWIIPKKEFVQFGVAPKDLFFYRALDPVIWLENHDARRAAAVSPAQNGLSPVVVCRETEWQSSYANSDIVSAVAATIRRRHRDWRVIDIPRYKPHRFYDVPGLLAGADLLIGGGGTMCIEAAYFGTPVIATRPLRAHYMQWLFDRRLAQKCATVQDAVRWAEQIIETRHSDRAMAARRRARRTFSRMTFPLQRVITLIQTTANAR